MIPTTLYKVLIVDDDRHLVDTMAESLEQESFQIYREYGGISALKCIIENQPDMVITDIRMPDLDGWELYERSRMVRPYPLFIFMTGYGNVPDATTSIKKGVFDYLEKPFSTQRLKLVVNSAMEHIDTLAENRSLKGKLDHLQNQYAEVNSLLRESIKVRVLTDFMSSLKDEDSVEEVLRKLLRASMEITGTKKGSIFLHRSRENSLELEMIDLLEDNGGISSHLLSAKEMTAQLRKGFLPTSLSDKANMNVKQEFVPLESSLSVSIEDAHSTWGVLYLNGKISEEDYSSEDFINVSSLSSKTVERLNQVEYTGQRSIFNTDREKLKKEHQRLQMHKTSLEKSSLSVNIIADQNLKPLYACERCKEIFGSESSELFEEQKLSSILGESLKQKIQESLAKKESFVNDELVSINMDSGTRLFKIRVLPFPPIETVSDFFVMIFEDITEQEKITKKLLLLENLAILGKFLANIAHDLNNPLDGLNRLVRILETKLGNNAEYQIFDMIYASIRRMGNTVRSFLDCTRDAMDRTTSSPLSELIEQAIYIMSPTLSDKNIKVIKEYKCADINISLPTSYYNAFINIIKNAFDAMSYNGTLAIKVVERESTGMIDVIFSDDGPGIPDSIMEDVVKPFFTTKEEGTGLGLSLCKAIANSFGGDLTFSNREGGGCDVAISILAKELSCPIHFRKHSVKERGVCE